MKKYLFLLILASLFILPACQKTATGEYTGSYPVSYSGQGGLTYYFCLAGECDQCYGEGDTFTMDLLNDKNKTANLTIAGPCFAIGTTGICEKASGECAYSLTGSYDSKDSKYQMKSGNNGLYSCSGDSYYGDDSMILNGISCEDKKGQKVISIGMEFEIPIKK